MGESVTEGTIVEWRKAEGDAVTEGEVIADVTTDKVDVEVPAPANGVLRRIAAAAGETVAVGAVIAEIDASPASGGAAAPAAVEAVAAAPPPAPPAAATPAPAAASAPAPAPPSAPGA